jgi:hypothetical protein
LVSSILEPYLIRVKTSLEAHLATQRDCLLTNQTIKRLPLDKSNNIGYNNHHTVTCDQATVNGPPPILGPERK